MNMVICYAAYLAISLAATIWVATTLHRNGRIFLVDAFHGNTELADSVNHLLVVGFYLINIGYVSMALRTPGNLAGSARGNRTGQRQNRRGAARLGHDAFRQPVCLQPAAQRRTPERFGAAPPPPPAVHPGLGRVLD